MSGNRLSADRRLFGAATAAALVFLAVVLLSDPVLAQGGGDLNPDLKTDTEALARFLDLRVGLSIHWGPSSQSGYEISWSRGTHGANQRQLIPVATYDQLYRTFNPTGFNADEWARLAKRWGLRYVLPTGKHHDGFALWFSRYSPYTMAATPFKRDIMKELGDACRKNGLVFGSYYSDLDFYHPDWQPYEPEPGPLFPRFPDTPNLERYLTYMKNQLTELIRDYGVEILQFDGEWKDTWTHEIGSRMYRDLHTMAPKVILSSRIDRGRIDARSRKETEWNWRVYAGDYEERERYVSWLPTREREVRSFSNHPCQAWATNDRRQWAWNPDADLLTSDELILDLIGTLGANCNWALNVPPRPDGTFHPRHIAILDRMGKWLKVNGDAVYGTRGGPFYPGEWGVSMKKGNKAYLHVTKWSGDSLVLPAIKQKVLSARLFAGGQPVTFRQSAERFEVDVPAASRDRLDTIITLEFAGPPEMVAQN
jgi:alpha-L-fucosidase